MGWPGLGVWGGLRRALQPAPPPFWRPEEAVEAEVLDQLLDRAGEGCRERPSLEISPPAG